MRLKLNTMMNMSVDIKLIILLVFIGSNIIGFLHAAFYMKYNGDFLNVPVNLDILTLFKILIVIIIQYIAVYILFIVLTGRLKLKAYIQNNNVNNLFYYIILIILIINFAATFYYKFPMAGLDHNVKFGFLITRLRVVDAVLILYCIERANKNKSKLFWVLVAGAVLLNLYRGWTSHLFFFIALELMLYFKSGIQFKKLILLSVFALLFLTILYPKIYDIKLQVRRGGGDTSVKHGLVHIAGRFSHFSQVAQIIEKKSSVENILRDRIGSFHYFKDALLVFIPGKSINGYSDKNSLHTYMAVVFDEKIDVSAIGSNSTTGIAGKFIALTYVSLPDAFLYLFFVLFLLSFIIIISNKLNFNLNYYSFIIIMFFTLSGVIQEIVFPVFQIFFWGASIVVINYICVKLNFFNKPESKLD